MKNRILFSLAIITLLSFSEKTDKKLSPTINGMYAINQTQILSNEITLNNWLNYLYYAGSEYGSSYIINALPKKNERNLKYFFNDSVFINFMKDFCSSYYFNFGKLEVNEIYEINEDDKKKYFENFYHKKEPYWLAQPDIPLTGISYEQAVDYCTWLTKMEETYIEKRNGKISDKKCNFYFKYRLPSQIEFEKFALDGILKTATTETEKLYRKGTNDKNCMLLLFNVDTTKTKVCDYYKTMQKYLYDSVATIYSFNPNNFGLYCVLGNVAEITDKKGIAMGGSYIHTIEECQPESKNTYYKPESWLGFRVIADVIVIE